jgi:Na+/H+-translocating membrane pyrophosphatase
MQGNTDSGNDDIPVGGFAIGMFEALSFLYGALCSGFAGYSGMWISIRANSRVASAARRCYNESIQIAFKGGYFAALINISLAIFGISTLFLALYCYLYFTIKSPLRVY